MMTPDSSKAQVPGTPPERAAASARSGARQGSAGEPVPAASGFAAVMSDLEPPAELSATPAPDSAMAPAATARAPTSRVQPAESALENLLARWRGNAPPKDTPPLAQEALARQRAHPPAPAGDEAASADIASDAGAPQPLLPPSLLQSLHDSWLQSWPGNGSFTARVPTPAAPDGSSAGPGTGGEASDAEQGSTADAAISGGRAAVTVLHRETHFAPVRTLTAHAQAFQQEMDAAADAAPGADAPQPRDPQAPADTAAPLPLPAASDPAGVGPNTPPMGGTGVTTSLPFTSLAQVSEAITQEAARLQSGLSSEGDANPAVAGPVRVLEMELSPETLGRVVIRMRLTGSGLDVKIRASSPETARMLEQDRDHLARLLETRGVSLEALQLDAAPSRGASAPAHEPSSFGQEREHAPGGDSQGRRDRAPAQPQNTPEDPPDEDPTHPASGRAPLG